MRNPGGLARIFRSDGPVIELDTITCKHCQRVVAIKPNTASTVYVIKNDQGLMVEEPGAFCRICMRPICLHCWSKGNCTPWDKKMEIAESKAKLLRAVGV